MSDSDVPIQCLQKKTRDLMSFLLNPKKIIPNEEGLSRDWHGLAELCDIGGERIPYIERTNDPTLKVLDVWSEKNKNESTTAKLLSFLEILDRFDIVEEIQPLIEKDAEYYRAHPEGFKATPQEIDDKDIITYDDAERKGYGLPPQTYDAFILFDDDDIDFANDIVNTLERDYNMKVCVKNRDVLGGEDKYESVIRLISTRCNRVVAVVSPSFLKSPTNKYLYSLARSEGIESQKRKVIPCIYKKCPELPSEFKNYHLLDYTRSTKFWDQLYKSIKVVYTPSFAVAREKPSRPTPSTNHVEFAPIEQPQAIVNTPVVEHKPPTEELPVSVPSTVESSQTQLKKKNSLLNKITKAVPWKNDKKEKVEEAPQINDSAPKKKKKLFWKVKKIKIAVPNS